MNAFKMRYEAVHIQSANKIKTEKLRHKNEEKGNCQESQIYGQK